VGRAGAVLRGGPSGVQITALVSEFSLLDLERVSLLDLEQGRGVVALVLPLALIHPPSGKLDSRKYVCTIPHSPGPTHGAVLAL
jgi:hypothetical protein